MTKFIVGLYARFSNDDLQNDASIEDQLRLANERIKQEGWTLYKSYSDAGISGSSIILRPAIQDLMKDAQDRKFNILLAESLDRISRDQEDIAAIYKRMQFAGIQIITLAEGVINEMHIGLKGTMNALFLSDLAHKTRRGLRGRIEKGKSAGGISYGYRVVKKFDEHGEPVRGEREINQDEAQIIRRIFHDYAHKNKSPRAIAAQLNKEHISGPTHNGWSQSTINGNRKRGTGILNNELYIGQMVWNKMRYIKNPDTGKQTGRDNPKREWIRVAVPDLRIVPDELWDAVKARQKQLTHNSPELWATNRPQYLLSGLVKCGGCGGNYCKINKNEYGCTTAKNKGASFCDNFKRMKQADLEHHVLDALQKRLMPDELVEIFADEYIKHLDHLHSHDNAAHERSRKEKIKLEAERNNLVQAIKDGIPADIIKDDLERVTQHLARLKSVFEEKAASKPALPSNIAKRYRQSVSNLRKSLNKQDSRAQAAQHLRTLIDRVVLTPRDKDKKTGLKIDLYGDLTGILETTTKIREKINTQRLKPKLLKSSQNFKVTGNPLDSVGGADVLATLSKDLTTALDIGRDIDENPYEIRDETIWGLEHD